MSDRFDKLREYATRAKGHSNCSCGDCLDFRFICQPFEVLELLDAIAPAELAGRGEESDVVASALGDLAELIGRFSEESLGVLGGLVEHLTPEATPEGAGVARDLDLDERRLVHPGARLPEIAVERIQKIIDGPFVIDATEQLYYTGRIEVHPAREGYRHIRIVAYGPASYEQEGEEGYEDGVSLGDEVSVSYELPVGRTSVINWEWQPDEETG
jgi:hypothetical protein